MFVCVLKHTATGTNLRTYDAVLSKHVLFIIIFLTNDVISSYFFSELRRSASIDEDRSETFDSEKRTGSPLRRRAALTGTLAPPQLSASPDTHPEPTGTAENGTEQVLAKSHKISHFNQDLNVKVVRF